MRIKKICKLILGLTLNLSLIASVPSVSYAKEKDTKEVQVYTETTDKFSKNVFEEVFTNEDTKFLRESLKAEIKYLEDSVEVKIRTRIQPSTEKGLTLYADGNPVEVSSKGTIIIPKNTKLISKLNKQSNHSNMKAKNMSAVNGENRAIVSDNFFTTDIKQTSSNKSESVFRVSSGELLEKMDQLEDSCGKDLHNARSLKASARKGYGDKYYTGDTVHCNRFNGQLTDDVHYNWRTGSAADKAKAVRNFYASDCHIALVQAGSGCTSKGSCQCNTTKRAAYCSSFTRDENSLRNCPYTYHKHTGLVIPR
ncbi:hypothetical protein B2H94_02690 [Clostridium sporogenes]|uniref:Uncharacterized protein n=2 Tax=Clostridium TaxID=1485 RepID=A0AAE4YYM2_CLOSG|nr:MULTISPECIES: hypothetical protein [Clostridium]EKS4345946.1 hypothetical protein [Clostridium botulinum]MBE6076956.1 hypothetical protein [Clostridium lundense]EDU38755.1 hypothetical protein CLOSPO_01617 [Clostridium sporogenes ATCC 15579]EKS4396954.1 hypothetical protein [Clostridium botulinum]KIS22895.1 hypothetical protein N495_04635 [Clostridium botulinum B2 450]